MVVLVAGGCGAQADYATDQRPPAPITITALVSARRVSVSPTRVGAGPIRLLVANAADRSLDVHVDAVDTAGFSAQSGPINPGGTASIAFDARSGTYRVSAKGTGRGARLRVGGPRPSAQNDVQLP